MQISVIIPTYKPKDYIWQCLDSLNLQTLPKAQWEVILVLNGCREPWMTELSQYIDAQHFTNLHVIQTDKAGVSNARNIGLDAAQGEYITFIDDDDYISPCYLEEMLHIASAHTIALAYTQSFSDKQNHIPSYIEQEYFRRAQKGEQPFYKAKKYFSGPWMKLMHCSIINNRRFDTRFRNGEDSLFMFSISDKIQNVNFTSTNAVYYRRIRVGSASAKQTRSYSLNNKWQMIKAYHSMYWKDPKSYNLWFYITRFLACVHAFLKGK